MLPSLSELTRGPEHKCRATGALLTTPISPSNCVLCQEPLFGGIAPEPAWWTTGPRQDLNDWSQATHADWALHRPESLDGTPTGFKQNVIVLTCGHMLHAGCLRDYKAAANRCPICRTAIGPEIDRELGDDAAVMQARAARAAAEAEAAAAAAPQDAEAADAADAAAEAAAAAWAASRVRGAAAAARSAARAARVEELRAAARVREAEIASRSAARVAAAEAVVAAERAAAEPGAWFGYERLPSFPTAAELELARLQSFSDRGSPHLRLVRDVHVEVAQARAVRANGGTAPGQLPNQGSLPNPSRNAIDYAQAAAVQEARLGYELLDMNQKELQEMEAITVQAQMAAALQERWKRTNAWIVLKAETSIAEGETGRRGALSDRWKEWIRGMRAHLGGAPRSPMHTRFFLLGEEKRTHPDFYRYGFEHAERKTFGEFLSWFGNPTMAYEKWAEALRP